MRVPRMLAPFSPVGRVLCVARSFCSEEKFVVCLSLLRLSEEPSGAESG